MKISYNLEDYINEENLDLFETYCQNGGVQDIDFYTSGSGKKYMLATFQHDGKLIQHETIGAPADASKESLKFYRYGTSLNTVLQIGRKYTRAVGLDGDTLVTNRDDRALTDWGSKRKIRRLIESNEEFNEYIEKHKD